MEIITALERIKPHPQTPPPSDDNIRRLHYNASGGLFKGKLVGVLN